MGVQNIRLFGSIIDFFGNKLLIISIKLIYVIIITLIYNNDESYFSRR